MPMPRWATSLLLSILLALDLTTAAWAGVGHGDFIVFAEGGFSGGTTPDSDTYYTTGTINYALTGNLGFWLGDAWEAGFGGGVDRVNYQYCGPQNSCVGQGAPSRNIDRFARYNFSANHDREHSFTGVEISYIDAGRTFGNVTVLRPYAGYRCLVEDRWALDLSVGTGLPMRGNTYSFTTN